MMKVVIKHQREVKTLMEANAFREHVFNLFGRYIKQKIVVSIETEFGALAIDNYEMQSSFDFDLMTGIFHRAASCNRLDQTFICTVEVRR